jgi:hypothetical protein
LSKSTGSCMELGGAVAALFLSLRQ